MLRRSRKTHLKRLRSQARAQAAAAAAPPWRRFTHAQLADFEARVHGTMVVPGDPDYDQARQVFYRQFQCFPEVIVYCETAGDVRACLGFAAAAGLPVVCRSGGHSSAGFSINDGMVVDLNRMNSVHVDPRRRLAVVEAGTPFHRLIPMLEDHGLHVPSGGCDEVCVGGYMQGGGYGFTSREFGMNCDNVVEVRMMLWNGGIVTANASTNVDLYWSVRGGMGGNFGVLLSITYALSPIGEMWGFGLSWGAADAAAALVALQSGYILGEERARLGYQCAVMIQDGAPRFYMRGLYNGPKDAGCELIRPLRALPGTSFDIERSGSYAMLNHLLLDQPVPIPSAPDDLFEEKQSGYVARMLDRAEWQAMIDFMATSPNPWNDIGIEPYGGRIGRKDDADAFIHRDAHMNLFMEVFWRHPHERDAVVRWLDDFMALMAPCLNGQSYQNYPRPGLPDAEAAYWADYLGTLQQVKAKYNPGDWFGNPQAITPPVRQPPGSPPPKGPKFPDAPIHYDRPPGS